MAAADTPDREALTGVLRSVEKLIDRQGATPATDPARSTNVGLTIPYTVHSEALSCTRGSSDCTRNTIDFRNYKKFGADTSITFEPDK